MEPIAVALSCVTRAVVRVTGYDPGGPYALFLNDGIPAELRGTDLSLTVAMQYRVGRGDGERGPWRVAPAAYEYALRTRQDREVLAYHWHPETREDGRPVRFPHLHVRCGDDVGRRLRKAHLPTGRVALEDVLRLLVAGLGARPLRPDWSATLTRTRVAFER